MRRVALLVIVLALANCSRPEPAVVVREVPVPVISPVKCVDPAAIPAEPGRISQKFNGDAKHDLELLADNAQELRDWGQGMRTLLELCVGKASEE